MTQLDWGFTPGQAADPERARTRLVRGHLGAAAVAGVGFAAMASAVNDLPTFVFDMALLWLFLRSLSTAAGVGFADAWSWASDDGVPRRPSRWDRFLISAVTRLETPAHPTGSVVEDKVRVLDPR